MAAFRSSSYVTWWLAQQPGADSSSAPQQSQNLQHAAHDTSCARRVHLHWINCTKFHSALLAQQDGDLSSVDNMHGWHAAAQPAHLMRPRRPMTACSWCSGAALCRTNPTACSHTPVQISKVALIARSPPTAEVTHVPEVIACRQTACCRIP
jgi:hypothetical protein